MEISRKDPEENPQKPNLKKNEVATITKDLDLFAGWIKRLENPDPVLRTEAAGKGIKLYDEVDRDAHAGSVLQTRYLSIVGKEWSITPAQSARKAGRPASTSREQAVADFVSQVLDNCNFDQARLEILQAILYGYYVLEVMWKPQKGAIVIDRLIGKHPRRFSFTEDRGLRLLTPQNTTEGEEVPNRKFVVFTFGDSDNPYGKGLGRRLWWPVWFKKHGIKFWMIFLEKFGMPTIKGQYPPGTGSDQQQKLLEAIKAIQTDTGITMPDTMDIEFLEASRAGTVSYEQLCEYMDKQVSKAVLGQTATTEGSPGKLGNEKAQEEVRQDIIEADADLLDTLMNQTLIRWLVDLNFPGGTGYPKIKTHAEAKPDLKERSDIDTTVVSNIGLPVGTQYFYETYGIPVPAEGEALVTPVKKTPAALPGQAPQFAEGDTPDWIERYLKQLGPYLQKAREDALTEIEEWLRSLPAPPSEERLQAKIATSLGSSYAAIDQKAFEGAVSALYLATRFSPNIQLGFGGPDMRAIDFLSKLDRFYTSKFITNMDAAKVMRDFIKEQYLEKNSGLYGRGNPEVISQLKDLLGQKGVEMEEWQLRRIIDTSVQRTRNWAVVAQMHEAGIAEIEIYEPTNDCAFCRTMNGKIISLPVAFEKITTQMNMTPEEYEADLRSRPLDIKKIDQIVSAGALPPYHPHCRGMAIKAVKS